MLGPLPDPDANSPVWWPALRGFLLYLGVWLLPLSVVIASVYKMMSAPLQRRKRAQLFLEVIEAGLASGRSPEQTVTSLAAARDETFGLKFHLLAAHIEDGCSLVEGLTKVPGFLPRQILAILTVGERVGDVRKVLPACKLSLRAEQSRVTAAVNYLVLLIIVNPLALAIPVFMAVVVSPKLHGIAQEYLQTPMPFVAGFMLTHWKCFIALQCALMVIACVVLEFYIYSGEIPWLEAIPGVRRVTHWLSYHQPWRQKRLQRDFSEMLAILLDAGIPEEQTVMLAAQSTGNRMFIERAGQVVQSLRNGVSLTEAVQTLDETGEFRWRVSNAVHSRSGFMTALRGWHEALDAKAYQLEQAASQTITTFLVVCNGCIVAVIAIGVFQILTSIVWELSLW
jgi:type II secretory pathway component PulF